MASHVDFVGILFIVWGVVTALVGLSTLALGVSAVALTASASNAGSGGRFAAGLTAAAFTILALIAIFWGVGHILIGVPLRRRQSWARLLALMVGSVDLVLLPFGTGLGCYTLWVLLSEPGKALFMADRASPSASMDHI